MSIPKEWWIRAEDVPKQGFGDLLWRSLGGAAMRFSAITNDDTRTGVIRSIERKLTSAQSGLWTVKKNFGVPLTLGQLAGSRRRYHPHRPLAPTAQHGILVICFALDARQIDAYERPLIHRLPFIRRGRGGNLHWADQLIRLRGAKRERQRQGGECRSNPHAASWSGRVNTGRV